MEVEEEAAEGAGCAPMELDGDVSEAVAMDADAYGDAGGEAAALIDGDRRARVCLHVWKVRKASRQWFLPARLRAPVRSRRSELCACFLSYCAASQASPG